MRIVIGLLLALVFSIGCFGQSLESNAAENFVGTSLDGQTFNLAALRGKVVLVTFWSTRCAICAAEVPKLNELAASYKNKNVVFLGLTNDDAIKATAFIEKKPFDFNILPNSFGTLLKYADRDSRGNIQMGYPAYYLINQQGEITLKANGYDKKNILNSEISRLLR